MVIARRLDGYCKKSNGRKILGGIADISRGSDRNRAHALPSPATYLVFHIVGCQERVLQLEF